jgi:hypothetical protein
MAGELWCGPAGSLVQLPRVRLEPETGRVRRGVFHASAAGDGGVMQTTGRARVYHLRAERITADQLSVYEQLFELPGPYRLVDTGRRNMLTANQSSGTDALVDTTGMKARFQGTVVSSFAQQRTRSRSLNWDTGGALAVTDRGVYFYTSELTVDATWTAVLPNTVYCASVYARADAAVSMYAGFDWHTFDGTFISNTMGTGTALGTTDWLTRLTSGAKTSPSNAAFGIPVVLNSATTAANRDVYLDDAQMEQASAATAAVVGTGTPVVAVDQLGVTLPKPGQYTVDFTLQEVG